jgi:hypothetical protein
LTTPLCDASMQKEKRKKEKEKEKEDLIVSHFIIYWNDVR